VTTTRHGIDKAMAMRSFAMAMGMVLFAALEAEREERQETAKHADHE